MADDKGRIYDSINEVNEEGALEKTNAQESLSGPDGREEHFKQNIMMDVDARPDGVEVVELSESQQIIEETDEYLTQTVQQDVSQTSVNLDPDRPVYESKDSDQQTLENQSLPLQDGAAQNQDVDQVQAEFGATGDDGSQSVEKFSAFELQSVDQQLEESVKFSDNENSAPEAIDSSATTDEDNIYSGQLIAQDDDNDALAFSIVTQPLSGSVTINPDGSFSFIPGDDFQTLADGDSQDVSFTYQVQDEGGAIDTAEIVITVTGANDGPVEMAVSNLSVNENSDGAVIGEMSTSDVDAGDVHNYIVDDSRFEIVNDGSGIMQLKLKDGEQLNHEAEETIAITVTSTDSGGLSLSQVFEINVVDINEAPTDITLDPQNIPSSSDLPVADFTAGDGYINANSIHDLGLEAGSNVFTLSFITVSDVTSPQTLFETGGSGTGLNVVIDQGILKVFAGSGNDLELSIPINGDTSYNFALEVNKSDDSLTMLLSDTLPLEEMTVDNSLADSQSSWADSDWDGGNDIGVGLVGGGSSQGNIGGDFQGTINDSGLNVYANSELTDVIYPIDAVVDENTDGAVVGNLSSEDVDAGDGHSYEVNDARFEVVEDGSGNRQLKLMDGVSLDHESESSLTVTVISADSGGLSTTEDFVILVNDINDAPVEIGLCPFGADVIAADGHDGTSVSALGLETGNNVFVMSFTTADDISSAQTLFETGGSGTGLNVVIDDGVIKVFAGSGNDLEISASIEPNTTYNFALGVSKDDESLTLLMSDTLHIEEMTIANSTVASQSGWTDTDWDGGNAFGVGDVAGNSSQGNIGGDFQGTINNPGLKVFANDDIDSVLSSIVINENDDGAVIGMLHTSDPDVGDTHTYAIDDVRFEVGDDGNGNPLLKLKDGQSLDYEDSDAITVTVTSTDSGGLFTTQDLVITVINDANEFTVSPVTDSDNATNEVSESASVGATVGVTAFASDEDAGDTVTYSLSANPGNAFSIDEDTGEVTVNDPSQLDFENASSMQIEVTATSDDGASSQTFNIAINDADEFDVSAVTDSDNATNEVSESASVGAMVGVTAFASDADGTTNDVSYSLSTNPGNAFSIDADTGEVTVNDPSQLDFENSASMQIEVTATSEDGSTRSEIFNIAINDADEFDVSSVTDSDNATNEVSESVAVGATVGVTAFASDADGTTNDVTYSLSVNQGNAFSIDADTGEITVANPAAINYENASSMQIEVTATSEDGSTSSESFNIAINDEDEFDVSAVTDSDATSNQVNESASVGTSVGITAFASDADGTTNDVSYSLSANPGNAFSIDADTGEVTVNDPSQLDFESSQVMQIEVTATSEDGSTSSETFSISITDDNSEFSIGFISDSDASENNVSENAANGAVVGVTAFAQDQDLGDGVTYSLSVNPNDAFSIDPDSGEVTVNNASNLDFESSQIMQIEVTATSDDGSTSVGQFDISINDADEFDVSAVTDSDNATNEVSESASAGATVGVIAFASDADGTTNDVTYSLSTNPGNAFSIDADTGEVTVNDPSQLDFENSALMQIEVTATSEDGSTSSETFNISINDADEFDVSAVTDLDNATNEVSESASAGATVGVIAFASDADGTMNDVTYSLSTNPGNAFSIDADTGEVTVNDPSALDFENAQSMQIEVTATSEDGSTSSETFNIAINDADEFDVSAVADSDNATNEVSESASAGASVGVTAFASDADGTNSDVSYSLSSNPGNAFSIDEDTGEVTVNDPSQLDFENAQSMQIEVTATSEDGSTSSETFNIAINDVDEFDVSAVTDSDNATNEVSESASAGASVGVTAFASDADGTNSDVSYSLSSNPGNAFSIDTDTGEVTVNDPSQLDFENAQSMQIEVTATSDDGSTSSETFNIGINDANEFNVSAVTDFDNATNEVSESAVVGTTVGVTAFASDADGTNSDVSYSLSSNPGNAFSVDADTGEVTVNDPSQLDFENSASMQIEVTATSEDGSTSSETFNIAINDADEFDVSAVADSDNTANEVSENAATGTTVGVTALASDQDGTNNDVTYSLSDDAGGRFTIDEISGEVSVADGSLLDHEDADSHSVTVLATSEDGSTSSEVFEINITDINEAPTDIQLDSVNDLHAVSLSNSTGNITAEISQIDNSAGAKTTVSFWMKADGSDTNGMPVSFGGSNYDIWINNDAIGFNTWNNNVYGVDDVGTEIAGEWHHVTAVFESFASSPDGLSLYIDGNKQEISHQTSYTGWTPREVGDTLEIGGHSGSWDFGGEIADVQVYNRELSESEVSSVFEGNTQSDLVAHYTFEGDTITEALVDQSGNGNDANVSFGVLDESNLLLGDTSNNSGELNIDENAEGEVIGTLTTTDIDDGDTHSYTVNDARFEVADDGDGNMQLKLKDGQSLDYEDASSVTITVTSIDSGGLSTSEEFVINVNDLNEASVSSISDSNIEENEIIESAAAGDLIGITAIASDADGDVVSYSLTSNPGDAFSIDPDTGEVTVNDPSALDFESASSMQIEVTATSEDGSVSSETFNIAVNDANEFDVSAVTDNDRSANQVSESAEKGASVGVTAFAEDEDGSKSDVTYSLSGDSSGAFGIDAETGEVYVQDPSALDFEKETAVKIEVTATSEDGSTSSESFEISINDANEFAISAVTDSDNTSNDVSEFASVGDSVGITASSSDADGSDAVSYSLTGNPDNAFAINQETGEVTVADPSGFDYETAQTVQIEITATSSDGSSSVESFTINIADVNEAPINLNFSGNENIASNGGSNILTSGSIVADVSSVVDPDVGDDFTFSLSDNASGKFQINSATGEISLNADHDNSEAYDDSISVLVTDTAGNTYTESIDIHIGTQGSDVITGGDSNDIIYGLDSNDDVTTGPNLIENGGFENSSTGWDLDSGPGFQIKSTGDGYGIDASEGSRYLDTDHSPGNMSFSQDVSGVTDGSTYQLSLDAAEYDSYDASLEIYWGGELVGTVEPGTTTMQHFEFEVTGGAGDGSNALQFVEVGRVDYGGTAVDNIQLVEILESNDELSGGAGDDSIYGGAGEDHINGDSGNDQLFGGEDTDTIDGGAGDDIIDGGLGNDVLSGGDGNDIFIFDQGDGSDFVDGGAGAGWVDSIDLSNAVDGAVDPSSPWQIEVDGEAVDYDINSGLLELGADVSGVIQFDDGTQLTFDNVENIEW